MHNIFIYTCLLFYFAIFQVSCGSEIRGWDYVNLHCRDNNNKPVDWWYIYKPPSDVIPYLELGQSFSYITSETAGRWQDSEKYLNANSMLQYTLSPIFRPTYTDYLAVAIYDKRKKTRELSATSTHGVLMAEEMAAVWLTHTVPGLIDLKTDQPLFPKEENGNGHLIMCLSVDLTSINSIARSVKQALPNFTYVQIPEGVEHLLPEWTSLESTSLDAKNSEILHFETSNKILRVELLVRRPGNTRCLYKTFAKEKRIVLDVYGQSYSEYFTTLCGDKYSVRNIESISLKLQDQPVEYIKSKVDYSRFAVSTAAHWQKLGSGPTQYWTCISNLDKEDTTAAGGLMLCVDHYHIWLTFDNLKVNEPSC